MSVTAQNPDNARPQDVGVGTDSHKHLHVAAVLDPDGGILGIVPVPADAAGCGRLLRWAAAIRKGITIGIESMCSYGAELASFLPRGGRKVVEVNRPERHIRRLKT